MDLGRNNPGDKGERFPYVCIRLQHFSGGERCELAARKGFPGDVRFHLEGYFPKKAMWLRYQRCTLPTWSATEWKHLYAAHFDENFLYDQSNPKIWEAIYNVSDEEIWKTRMVMKNKLIDYVQQAIP